MRTMGSRLIFVRNTHYRFTIRGVSFVWFLTSYANNSFTTKNGDHNVFVPIAPRIWRRKPQILNRFFILYLPCFFNCLIWCRELHVCIFMLLFGVSNSIPYVPRFFLVLSRTSHDELHVKLFCVECNALETLLTMKSDSHVRMRPIILAILLARTYGNRILLQHRASAVVLKLVRYVEWNALAPFHSMKLCSLLRLRLVICPGISY
jgi:hypothetical protein